MLTPDEQEIAEHSSPPAAEEDAAAGLRDHEPDTSADELPETVGRDSVQLFAQSPHKLFVHWGHAGDPFAALREAFGDAASRYRLVVRLSCMTDDSAQTDDASPERAQWLAALPDRDYRADIGFHADGLPFITLLSSSVVHTPRAAVSPNADAEPQFHIAPDDFSRLLEHTGYDPGTLEQPATTQDARDPKPFAYCHFSSGQWSVKDSSL
ncbi:MAG TPA: DUF4912 domain-containing protein [Pyrinomonadaceae bacterium]